MATGKKSFILYTDLIHMVGKLDNEKAGELFKHILDYVNDNNPEPKDMIIDIAFEPIKQQLKRDLTNWNGTRIKRVESGKLGGLKSGESRRKKANKANALKSKQKKANEAVNVNVNDSVNDNGIDKIKKIKEEFYNSLTPFVEKYGKEAIREFYDYWSEPNPSNTKIRKQLEKTWSTPGRLARWANSPYNKGKETENPTILNESIK